MDGLMHHQFNHIIYINLNFQISSSHKNFHEFFNFKFQKLMIYIDLI